MNPDFVLLGRVEFNGHAVRSSALAVDGAGLGLCNNGIGVVEWLSSYKNIVAFFSRTACRTSSINGELLGVLYEELQILAPLCRNDRRGNRAVSASYLEPFATFTSLRIEVGPTVGGLNFSRAVVKSRCWVDIFDPVESDGCLLGSGAVVGSLCLGGQHIRTFDGLPECVVGNFRSLRSNTRSLRCTEDLDTCKHNVLVGCLVTLHSDLINLLGVECDVYGVGSSALAVDATRSRVGFDDVAILREGNDTEAVAVFGRTTGRTNAEE